MSEIELPDIGATVKLKGTEMVGSVTGRSLSSEGASFVTVKVNPRQNYLVPAEILEAVAPPLPPEPPVGAYVEVLPDESSVPEVWKRFPYINPLHRSLWHDANHPSDPARTWAELHKDGAKVTRLYREDEIDQYEAISEHTRSLLKNLRVQQFITEYPAAVALRAAAKELRHNGPTVPKFYPDDRERVANWLDSLADFYEGRP